VAYSMYYYTVFLERLNKTTKTEPGWPVPLRDSNTHVTLVLTLVSETSRSNPKVNFLNISVFISRGVFKESPGSF
jgi:ribonucleotide reductase beta subunit family protein with ferritin-like domain